MLFCKHPITKTSSRVFGSEHCRNSVFIFLFPSLLIRKSTALVSDPHFIFITSTTFMFSHHHLRSHFVDVTGTLHPWSTLGVPSLSPGFLGIVPRYVAPSLALKASNNQGTVLKGVTQATTTRAILRITPEKAVNQKPRNSKRQGM